MDRGIGGSQERISEDPSPEVEFALPDVLGHGHGYLVGKA